MRLNLQSDYALRLLMHLALEDKRLVTIGEVATRFRISKNHLTKVAHVLGRQGFVTTVRGRAGGMRLAKSASELVVGDIVRQMEGDFALVECFPGGADQCLITPACRLKKVLNEALEAFLSVLDDFTIDDLVRRNPELRSLLAID